MSVQHTIPRPFPVVSFPAQQDQITQTELVLFLSLRGRLEQLQAQVEDAAQSIQARLEAGMPVQPGDHVARLDEHSRRNVSWRAVTENLADEVFGEGRGKAYANEILDETQPTISTSLVVR
jgi:hypothetical protein